MRRMLCVGHLLAVGLTIAVTATATAADGPSIWTVAGSGAADDHGDGGLATAAGFVRPYSVDVTANSGLLIADWGANRVRLVAGSGTITTVAGTGMPGTGGDGGPATAAQLLGAVGVSVTADGGFLIAEWDGHRIRRVAPDGTITTAAGTGVGGFAGDGGPATAARLAYPNDIAPQADGGFLIADWINHRIRRVAPNGTISTVAGTGVEGFSGDGGPATSAQLNDPIAVAALADGGFLITDHDNARIRRVGANGVITTVAGTGSPGFSGDGGPATAARLDRPVGLDAAPDGSFLVADRFNERIRRVAADGTITTVAGSGIAGFAGDGGLPTDALLDHPSDVALLPGGGFVVADESNHRVRLVTPGGTTEPFPPAVDTSLVAEVKRPGPISALGGRLVWSQYDSGAQNFTLMTRDADGVPRRVPVERRRVPFDVDLGTSRAGHVVAAYSRCVSDTRLNVERLPNYHAGRGCAGYMFDFMTRRETRLRTTGSSFLPSVSTGHVAFARRHGARSDVYLRAPGGRARRVARSVRGLTRLDLSGRRLAFAAKDDHGRRAVWLTSSRHAARRVSPRVTSKAGFASPALSDGSLYFTGPRSLWRYRLSTGTRRSVRLPRQPVTLAMGSRGRAFLLTRDAGPVWELRARADLNFTTRP
jgi:hypothetical protein